MHSRPLLQHKYNYISKKVPLPLSDAAVVFVFRIFLIGLKVSVFDIEKDINKTRLK